MKYADQILFPLGRSKNTCHICLLNYILLETAAVVLIFVPKDTRPL